MSVSLSGEPDDNSRPHGGAQTEGVRRAELHQRAAQLVPILGETASAYAARLSARLASVNTPDFVSRLSSRSAESAEAGRRLRILSLGTGSGAAEHMLLSSCDVPVELVLTGDDEEALSAVVAAFDPRHHVACRVVDLEAGLARWKDRFDVVFSHAALSRVVRLEPLLRDIAKLLSPGGELWVSREQAGEPGRHGGHLRQWLHSLFVPVYERGSGGIAALGIPSDLDLARKEDLARIRAAAVEGALLVEAGRLATHLDGIYAIRPAH